MAGREGLVKGRATNILTIILSVGVYFGYSDVTERFPTLRGVQSWKRGQEGLQPML